MLLAYSNNIKIKNKYVRQFRAHIKADDLIRGAYVESVNSHWRGCAVGCLLNARTVAADTALRDHLAFETEPIQFPEWLGQLLDTLHENTSSIEFSADFNTRLLKAIPVGFSDWDSVKYRFLSYLMQGNIERVQKLNISKAIKTQVIAAIQQCKEWLDSEDHSETQRSAAWSAARSAWSAARSAARSARSAWAAAWAAAWSASWAASWAASWSASRSAAWSAARSAAFDEYANYLLTLFAESK